MTFGFKRNTWKHWVVFAFATVLVLQGCTRSGAPEQSVAEKTPIKITALTYTNAKGPIAEDNVIIKEIEARLNIDLEFQWVPNAQVPERLNVLMASGDLPDITYMYPGQYRKWRDQGAFLDLTEHVKAAPNLLAKIPESVWKINDPNGSFHSFPYANPPHREDILIRKDWLDAAGLQIPRTAQEMSDVLNKLVHSDPDRNGKDDTYGFLILLTPDTSTVVTSGMLANIWVEGAFGLGHGWKAVDGDLVPAFLQPEMKDVLLFMKEQYDNGVLSKDFIIAKSPQGLDDFRAGKSVFTYANNRLKSQIEATVKKVHPSAVTEFIDPPAGPTGLIGNEIVEPTASMFAVSASVKDETKIKKIVELMDYLVSDEGYELTKYGIKDKHYTVESETVWKALPGIEEDRIGDMSAFFFRPYDPGLNIRKTESEKDNKIVERLVQNALDNGYSNPAWGIYSPLEEKYAADLNNIAKETVTKIIMGEQPIEFLGQQQQKWRASGGDEVVAEVNKLYQETK